MEDFLQQLSDIFIFDTVELTITIILFIILLYQMFIYIRYYGKPVSWVKKRSKGEAPKPINSNQPKVSVVIEAENEAEYLSELLPQILSQDYPDFEVIVVNNGSTDETGILLERLELEHSNLYHTFLPHSRDKYGFRKMALTLGIKAAKGDILLFIESYSRPVSNQWIKLMTEKFTEDKDIVLGYSKINKTKPFWTRIEAFDNLIFSLQYLSMALRANPFTGTYRNLAFRRNLFFENKGFSQFLYLENSEDTFINRVATKTNTAICIDKDSFTETISDIYSLWRQIKRSYSAARSCFKGSQTTLFSSEYLFRWIFLIALLVGVSLTIYNQHWAMLGIVLFILLLSLLTRSLIINKAARYFEAGKYYFSLSICSLLQPIYNIRFRHKVKNPIR